VIDGVEPAAEPDPAPAGDAGLPLLPLDRRLAPIRRVAAFAVDHPDRVAHFEVNARRWLEPLLLLELPEPIRESLVSMAGQLSGFDTLDTNARRGRIEKIRQLITRLDAVLGLPLPRSEHRPRRPERRARKANREASSRSSNSSRGRGRSKSRPVEKPDVAAPKTKEPEVRRAFWNGNPYLSLTELEIEPQLGEGLARAGILIVRDLLLRSPQSVETYRPIHGAGRELPEGRVAVGGRLTATWTVCHPDGSGQIYARLQGAGPVTLSWSSAEVALRWLDGVRAGERVVVVGTWNGEYLVDPEAVFESGKSVNLPRFGVEGVEDARIQALLFRLAPSLKQLRDPLGGLDRRGQISLSHAIEALHGRGDAEAGRLRLAFDEALVVSLGHGWARYGSGKVRGIQHSVAHSRLDRLLDSIGVRLSDSQQLAFDQIKRDLRRSRPMRRVLVGGPGGGKGLLALLTAVLVAEGKCQVLWLSSDTHAAETWFTHCEPLIREAGMVTRIAPDNPNGAMRDAIKRGEVHVLFATPKILQADVEFRRLGLIVSSESSDSGVVSRAVEDIRSPRPDLLVVPATPPCLSTLLDSWPDHEISQVPGCPAPDVVVKSASNRVSAYAPARHAIMGGGQVAVLFPQFHGADALDPTEAHRVVAALAEEALSGSRLTLLHGAMPREEQQRVVSDFSHRRSDAIVSTAPLEDAAPIPGLQLAVVEHAHRIDPRRLCRIAGMNVEQITLVVEDGTTPERAEELTRQVKLACSPPADPAELPGFRFLRPETDTDLLIQARNLALDILVNDPGLRSGRSGDLVRAARAAWPQLFGAGASCSLPQPVDASGKRRRRRRRRK